jgi:uncharacterized protein (DUF433 family)
MSVVLDSELHRVELVGARGEARGCTEPLHCGERPDQRAFATFASDLRQELAPRSLLEEVLANRVILAAWTLQTATEKEHAAIADARPSSSGAGSSEAGRAAVSPQAVYVDLQCLEKALYLFRCLGSDELVPTAGCAPTSEADPEIDSDGDLDDFTGEANYSNEWPELGQDRTPESAPAPADREDRAIDASGSDGGSDCTLGWRWQDRLFMDPNVSEHSPVIKGTWITVGQVVSLIVDGWAWEDLLRAHPELTEEDIRTCLSYAVAEETGDL